MRRNIALLAAGFMLAVGLVFALGFSPPRPNSASPYQLVFDNVYADWCGGDVRVGLYINTDTGEVWRYVEGWSGFYFVPVEVCPFDSTQPNQTRDELKALIKASRSAGND